MPPIASRLSATIDLEAPGKRLGLLRLTHSGNRHGFGVIPVPIAVIRGGDGPTVLATAGNHGDEYEGQVILQRLVRELEPGMIRGRLIVMPALNLPAVLAESRTSPLDDGNLNRAFPGDPDGGPTAALAHWLESVMLPVCDAAIDLHSAGRRSHYMPACYLHGGGGPALLARKIAGARAFGAPVTVLARTTSDHRSMSAAADRLGVCMVATEIAGGGAVTRATLEIGRHGVLRYLRFLGLLGDDAPTAPPAPCHSRLVAPLGAQSSVMAPTAGLFEPTIDLGALVAAGDRVGRIHPITELDRPWVDLHAPHAGTVIVLRAAPLVEHGNYVAQIAVDLDEAALL